MKRGNAMQNAPKERTGWPCKLEVETSVFINDHIEHCGSGRSGLSCHVCRIMREFAEKVSTQNCGKFSETVCALGKMDGVKHRNPLPYSI